MNRPLNILSEWLGALPLVFLFPLACAYGGSTNLINWGPGLAIAGLVALTGVWGSGRRSGWGFDHHAAIFLTLLACVALRAALSPYATRAAADLTLVTLAGLGYCIARTGNSRELLILSLGLALASVVNCVCLLVQLEHPEWNPVYPGRSAVYPSGLFAHYNYAAAFSMGAAGLLLHQARRASLLPRICLILGMSASLLSLVLSYSRSGILTLCFMVVAGFLILLLRAFRERKTEWIWLLIASGIFIFWQVGKLAVNQTSEVRGGATDVSQAFNDGGRLMFCSAALRLVGEKPLLGNGAGSFGRDVFRVLEPASAPALEPGMTHNELLQLLVDYGGLAAIGLLLVMLLPMIAVALRFIQASEWEPALWSVIGLGGMLLQSNFDSTFHCSPCVLLAGMLLGVITRRDWQAVDLRFSDIPASLTRQSAATFVKRGQEALHEAPGTTQWRGAIMNFANAYLAGDVNSSYPLLDAIALSPDPEWQEQGLQLAKSLNSGNRPLIDAKVREIAAASTAQLSPSELLTWSPLPGLKKHAAILTGARSLIASLLTLAALGCGLHLTNALRHVWRPMYQPETLGSGERFSALARAMAGNPRLGVQRFMLDAFLDRLYEFQTREAREHWAEAKLPELLHITLDAENDPGLALQLACIAGWAGDERGALRLYQEALEVQAGHERIFMASYFHGEYLYELAISAKTGNQTEKAECFAAQATENLKKSAQAMGGGPAKLGRMLQECLEITR
jgi:hypothetical protein